LDNIISPVIARFEDLAEVYWLSPALLRILPAMRALPMRFNRFYRYAVEAFLLKEAGADIEFMHRLLRDYFALRDLQPRLHSSNSSLRLQAVRSLGYQGDAAIDALADFVRNGDVTTKEAAAWALGRISSPEVEPHLAAALEDPEPLVRAAGVLSSRVLGRTIRERLLTLVLDDRNPTVQQCIAKTILTIPAFHITEDPLGKKWIRQVKARDELQQIILSFISLDHPDAYDGAIAMAVRLRDRRAVPAIIGILGNADKPGRMQAAHALGHLEDPAAVNALVKALRDQDPDVRSMAAQSLMKLEPTYQLPPTQRPTLRQRLFRGG
jgi:HEAT repeat protein